MGMDSIGLTMPLLIRTAKALSLRIPWVSASQCSRGLRVESTGPARTARSCEPSRQCRRGPRESSRCSSLESPPQLRSQSSSQCRCAHHLFGFPRVASFKPGVARVPEVHASLSVGGGDGRRQLKDDHHWCRDGHELPGFSNPAYSVLVSLGLIHIGVEIAAMRHDWYEIGIKITLWARSVWARPPTARSLLPTASSAGWWRSKHTAAALAFSF